MSFLVGPKVACARNLDASASEILCGVGSVQFTGAGGVDGTGLGLSIVRQILDRHDASIAVVSEPGRTCFEVKLPSVVSSRESS
jgi:hypothetical protein